MIVRILLIVVAVAALYGLTKSVERRDNLHAIIAINIIVWSCFGLIELFYHAGQHSQTLPHRSDVACTGRINLHFARTTDPGFVVKYVRALQRDGHCRVSIVATSPSRYSP